MLRAPAISLPQCAPVTLSRSSMPSTSLSGYSSASFTVSPPKPQPTSAKRTCGEAGTECAEYKLYACMPRLAEYAEYMGVSGGAGRQLSRGGLLRGWCVQRARPASPQHAGFLLPAEALAQGLRRRPPGPPPKRDAPAPVVGWRVLPPQRPPGKSPPCAVAGRHAGPAMHPGQAGGRTQLGCLQGQEPALDQPEYISQAWRPTRRPPAHQSTASGCGGT